MLRKEGARLVLFPDQMKISAKFFGFSGWKVNENEGVCIIAGVEAFRQRIDLEGYFLRQGTEATQGLLFCRKEAKDFCLFGLWVGVGMGRRPIPLVWHGGAGAGR
ncbi:hypothetical protein [Acidiphilium acidophilum]|uniref:Uncharacterized protein n=1 Tax=Acidiphilium acidophilum TaxID=76588 RepID=A0AAW9DLY5_ACIAO|nr:hypothetical protein [Acidiphilium acidophilum]MDX5930041.1 hypothetical protein [Acidiphilium acidophilum]